MPTPVAAVRVVHVTKTCGEGVGEVRALDDVTVDMEQGRFTAVMGPSGSGTSTLMHVAAGLDTATSGSVLLGGTDLTTLKDKELTALRRDRIGFVFRQFNGSGLQRLDVDARSAPIVAVRRTCSSGLREGAGGRRPARP